MPFFNFDALSRMAKTATVAGLNAFHADAAALGKLADDDFVERGDP